MPQHATSMPLSDRVLLTAIVLLAIAPIIVLGMALRRCMRGVPARLAVGPQRCEDEARPLMSQRC